MINKNLIAVKSEYYTSGAFENIKIYAISGSCTA